MEESLSINVLCSYKFLFLVFFFQMCSISVIKVLFHFDVYGSKELDYVQTSFVLWINTKFTKQDILHLNLALKHSLRININHHHHHHQNK